MKTQVLLFCAVTPCSDVVGYQRSDDILLHPSSDCDTV